jgi:hypothetical protein
MASVLRGMKSLQNSSSKLTQSMKRSLLSQEVALFSNSLVAQRPPGLHVGHSPDNFDAVIVEGLQAQANVSPARSQECLAFGAVTIKLQRGRGFQECLFLACGWSGYKCGWMALWPDDLVGFEAIAFNRPGMGPNLLRMVLRRFLVASL